MARCTVLLVCLFVAGASAYKELIGTWVGSCQQVGSANKTGGPNTICTGSPKIQITSPFMVEYSVVKSKTIKGGMDLQYAWQQPSVIIDYGMETYYNVAVVQNATYSLGHSTPWGKNVYCITSRRAGPAAFMASVRQLGARTMYMEEGIIGTPTNHPSKDCPLFPNLPLYCDDVSYNYACTAFKI